MAYKIIDVSTWQGEIDWNKVKADGVQGVILRACYGWDWVGDKQVDQRFYEYVNGAKSVGLPIGAYHYSYATNRQEAIREAVSFMQVIKGINFELPVFYDIEEKCQYSLSSEQLTDIACAFCETLESKGYYVGIYASTSWMKRFNYDRIKRYTLWVAQYYNVCQYPNNHDMWQYTSSGMVDGINGRVDINHCYRDYLGEIKNRGGNPIQEEDENMIKELQAQIDNLKAEIKSLKANVIDKDNRINVLSSLNSALQNDLNELIIEAEKARNLAGDIDGDKRLTTKDVLLIMRKLAGK